MTKIEEMAAALQRAVAEYGDAKRLAAIVEHTLLDPAKPPRDALRTVEEAAEYGFACAVLSPYHARIAARSASELGVELCAVIGFPGGFQSTRAKLEELEYVAGIAAGVDIVLNIQAAVAGDYALLLDELSNVVDHSRQLGIGHVKVIVEAPLLGDEALEAAVKAAAEAGADYVKTSTGVYSKGGDYYTVARLSRLAVKYGLKVKAAGGVKTALDALLAIAAGAERIGTSSGVDIVKGLKGRATP